MHLLGDLATRATIGPLPGEFVLLCGFLFHGSWMVLALVTLRGRRGRGLSRAQPRQDQVLDLARQTA